MITFRALFRSLVVFVLLGSGLSVKAQNMSDVEGAGLQAGPFRILPTIGLMYGYDDNVARTEVFQYDSYYYVVSPGIRVELPNETWLLSLTWEYDLGRYDYSSLDDYDDRHLGLEFTWDPNARHHFDAYATDIEGHDARGEGARQGPGGLLPLPIDTWENQALGGTWTYGALGARGQLTLEAGLEDRQYTNNREFTRFRDYESDRLGAQFAWRVAPKTLLGLGVTTARFDYDASDPFSDRGVLDSDQSTWFLSAQWDLAARTSGSVRVGRQKKEFDSPDRGDYDNDYWAADVTWRPRSYSAVTLIADNSAQESDGYGDFVQRQSYAIEWQHHWQRRLTTTLEGGVGTEKHEGGQRDDDLTWYGISAQWRFSKHWQFGAGWQYYERDSTLLLHSFDQSIWSLALEGSL